MSTQKSALSLPDLNVLLLISRFLSFRFLTLVALGHTSQEMAEQMNLSAKTVDTYRARMLDKLGLKTRATLVRFALQRGLLDNNRDFPDNKNEFVG